MIKIAEICLVKMIKVKDKKLFFANSTKVMDYYIRSYV